MYLIEGHWETLDNLHDISRVIREYYNPDLADILDELIEAQEDEIKRLEESIDELELDAAIDVDYLADEIDNLESIIDILKRKIVELEFPNGL